MRKFSFAGALLALLCAAALFTSALVARVETDEAAAAAVDTAFDPYSALRLHVIANSDSEADQSVKLAVRDAVLEKARLRFAENDVTTADEAKELLMDMGAELYEAAESTVKAYGADSGVQLEYGAFEFPDREYNGTKYPAGEYNALRIILGEGEGHNWWCVMFPPLCIIEEPDAPAEYNDDGTLQYKSFLCELFHAIFG